MSLPERNNRYQLPAGTSGVADRNAASLMPGRTTMMIGRSLFIVGWLLAAGCSDPVRSTGGSVGQVFPPLDTVDQLDTERTERVGAGKVRVINFWASWCLPCRREMPSLDRLADRLDPQRYEVLGISVDSDRYLAMEFLIANSIRFTNYLDPDRDLAEGMLDLDAYPVTFVVAADGTIARRIIGDREWDDPELVMMIEKTFVDTAKRP